MTDPPDDYESNIPKSRECHGKCKQKVIDVMIEGKRQCLNARRTRAYDVEGQQRVDLGVVWISHYLTCDDVGRFKKGTRER